MFLLLAAALVRLQISDLPSDAQAIATSAEQFDRLTREIDTQTEVRLRDGEWDHLVFYLLQSRRFTDLDPIEPAISARAYHDTGSISPAVARRIDAFLAFDGEDTRMKYFRRLGGSRPEIEREYRRAMHFLYEKEFASRDRQGSGRREFVARLYQNRGHSSDTSVEASFGTHIGLSVIRSMWPEVRIRRVLVVGPGLDFAPRTGLRTESEPRSYQPYLVADSLIRNQLAEESELRIDCVDLNPRVVEFVGKQAPPESIELWAGADDEHRDYVAGFRPTAIRPAITRANIVTERLDSKFDLIVATNVLLYLPDREMTMAFANIRAMLGPGGLFLHNELRDGVERYGEQLKMPIVHARMVRLSKGRELYDGVVIHRAR